MLFEGSLKRPKWNPLNCQTPDLSLVFHPLVVYKLVLYTMDTMPKTYPLSFNTLDLYLKSKKGIWAETTLVTTKAKLNKLIQLQISQPFKLLQELKLQDYSPYTIQVYFEIWRGFEKFCYAGKSPTNDFLKSNRGIFRNAYQNKTYLLTLKEYQALLAEVADKQKGLFNMLLLMGQGGLRLSEALSATWEDIGADEMLRVVGKGGKVRLVPIPLSQFYKREEIKSKLIAGDKPAYEKFFKNKPCTPHDLRAFYATSLANTVSIHELMDLLGHNNFNTVLRYIRRNPTIIKGKLNGYFESVQGTNRSNDRSD